MRAAWSLPTVEATEALGAAMGQHCPWGGAALCVHLAGDLGAGKTTLAASLLRALGVQDVVRSPTYALLEIYAVAAGLAVHLDLYRLRGVDELEQLGLRDYLQPNTLLLIEWPEHGHGGVPAPDLRVALESGAEGRDARVEAFSTIGEAWLAGVERAVPPMV
jgi:tRNA threonylcarbamoyladenosine biosynthesis protein TsaE